MAKLERRSAYLYYMKDEAKVIGIHTELRGDCTGMRGDCSGLRGDCSGLWGDCSGLWGDLDDITAEERSANPNIQDYADA